MNETSIGYRMILPRGLAANDAIERLRQWAAEAFLEGKDVEAKCLRDAAERLRSLP